MLCQLILSLKHLRPLKMKIVTIIVDYMKNIPMEFKSSVSLQILWKKSPTLTGIMAKYLYEYLII